MTGAARLGQRATLLEVVGFGAIVALAAVLRLVDLPTRGTWDADQGHDMLVLRDLVVHGRIPLLGPPTSIGDFHHGMLYYVLLAPAAFISGADPVAVAGWIALGGIAAVAVTGWLARAIAGPVAGLIAALLLAVSASAVEESVFIWNPNVIALSSSVALAAAWRAWSSGRTGWWVVAGGASVVTMHAHVLGAALTPVVGALLVADARRRRASGADTAALIRAAAAWLAIGVVSYVPLLIHEVGSNASELRAALAFLGGEGQAATGLSARIPIVGLRVLAWPLTGLITAAPLATVGAAALVVGLAVWLGWARPRTGGSGADSRIAARWLGLGLVWTILALAVGASGLATVVPGLPNDHYHAFADPMVVVLVGVGLAALAQGRAVGAARLVPAVGALAVLLALVGWNLVRQPPRVVADGGWPQAERAAARVLAATDGGPIVLASLPVFKTDEALRFPLVRAGVLPEPAGPQAGSPVGSSVGSSVAPGAAYRVVLCDQLFREAIGADCGGPAEDALIGAVAPALALVDRFEAAPGRWISIYRPLSSG